LPNETPETSYLQDLEQVTAVLKGDESAYLALIETHQPMVARLMWRFTRDPLKLEELVHDTFVQTYFSLAKYRGAGPLGGWIRTIAVRAGYRHWKEKARDKDRQTLNEQMAYDPALLHMGEDTSENPEAAHRVLYDALAQLPPRDRLVLTLLYWENCSTEEAARLTGWSGSMVRVQAFRARNKLKKLLEKTRDGRT
jgi:RNA polymerase sigma-70 factor (ECF subfamily)